MPRKESRTCADPCEEPPSGSKLAVVLGAAAAGAAAGAVAGVAASRYACQCPPPPRRGLCAADEGSPPDISGKWAGQVFKSVLTADGTEPTRVSGACETGEDAQLTTLDITSVPSDTDPSCIAGVTISTTVLGVLYSISQVGVWAYEPTAGWTLRLAGSVDFGGAPLSKTPGAGRITLCKAPDAPDHGTGGAFDGSLFWSFVSADNSDNSVLTVYAKMKRVPG